MRMYMKYAELKGWKVEVLEHQRDRSGRHQRGDLRAPRARRVLAAQVGRRRAPRPARACDRGAGAHPHVVGDGERAAQGRGSRRADSRRGPAGGRLPRGWPRRPGRQHDRLGGAADAPADRAGRDVPGRALADQEQGARDGSAAIAALRDGAAAAAGRSRVRAAVAGRLWRARLARFGRTTTARTA